MKLPVPNLIGGKKLAANSCRQADVESKLKLSNSDPYKKLETRIAGLETQCNMYNKS
jgi:hypothetical protein